MKLSMSTKIFFGFLAVMLAFAGVSAYSIVKLHGLGTRLHQLGDHYLPLSKVAAQLEAAQNGRRTDVARVLEVDEPAARDQLIRHTKGAFLRAITDRTRFARASIDRGVRGGALQAEDPWVKGVLDRIGRIERYSTEYEDAVLNLFALLEGSDEPSQGKDAGVRETDQRVTRELRLLAAQMEAKISSISQAARREELATTWGVILWSIIALVVAVVVLVLSQITLSPLGALREKVVQIARGNYFLRTGMEGEDEVGLLAKAIDDMAMSLQQRERDVGDASDKLVRATADLRRAMADLMVLRAYAENIFRSIRSAILALDDHGGITGANPAAEALWGFRAKDAAGKTVAALPGWGGIPDVGSAIDRAMIGRAPVVLEGVAFGAAGAGPLVDLTVTPLEGEEGGLRGALIIGEDVTEKTRTKQRLIQAERLAAIGRLAAQITHEVRNPLSAIGLNAELLEETIAASSTPEAKRLLQAIQSEITRLAEITEEYLQFARLPSARLKRTDLNETVRSLLAFMSIEMSRGNVKIRCDCAQSLPPVNGDASQLRQAFMNIVRNSFEAMPGGGEIVVATAAVDGAAVVTFTDTGPGIAPAHLARVFEPFFSTKESGIGLGLSITQQVVSDHGGTITAASAPGGGTTFTVTIPGLKE